LGDLTLYISYLPFEYETDVNILTSCLFIKRSYLLLFVVA